MVVEQVARTMNVYQTLIPKHTN